MQEERKLTCPFQSIPFALQWRWKVGARGIEVPPTFIREGRPPNPSNKCIS